MFRLQKRTIQTKFKCIYINKSKEKEGIFVEKRTHAKHIILILLGSLIYHLEFII